MLYCVHDLWEIDPLRNFGYYSNIDRYPLVNANILPWKEPVSMRQLPISMAMFNSYVKLLEDIHLDVAQYDRT